MSGSLITYMIAGMILSPLTQKNIIKEESAVLDYPLVHAMISVESSWVKDAVSDKKAYGLMQITRWAVKDVDETHSSYRRLLLDDILREDADGDEARWFLQRCTLKNKYSGLSYRELLRKSLTDERLNVRIGTCYLLILMRRYDGDLYKVLAAYNGGPKQVSLLERGSPIAKETANYIVKALQARDIQRETGTWR